MAHDRRISSVYLFRKDDSSQFDAESLSSALSVCDDVRRVVTHVQPQIQGLVCTLGHTAMPSRDGYGCTECR
jgi:hypothetical protein